jgi:hypothetical protein
LPEVVAYCIVGDKSMEKQYLFSLALTSKQNSDVQYLLAHKDYHTTTFSKKSIPYNRFL